MKALRTSATCVLVTCALGAVAPSTATAVLPEFTPPFTKTFISEGGKTVLETAGGFRVRCTATRDLAHVEGPFPLVINVIIRFTGCEAKGFQCTSPGEAAGAILTPELFGGTLGYISATKEVGMRFGTGPESEALFAEFDCGAAFHLAVRGSVIGKIVPLNKSVLPPAHFTVRFSQKGGTQQYPKFFGGKMNIFRTNINFGPPEDTGLDSLDRVTFAFGESVELLA